MLIFITLLLCLFLYGINQDIFSPAKIFVINLVVYHFDIFLNDYSLATQVTYVFYVFLAFLLGWLEFFYHRNISLKPCIDKRQYFIEKIKNQRVHGLIWFASSLPLLAQLYMFHHFGGVQQYLTALPGKVITFQGLGFYLIAISLFQVINLVYFTYLIMRVDCKKRELFIYLLHLSLGIALAVLSASRTGILIYFVYVAIILHYFYRPIRIITLMFLGVFLLLSAGVLEVTRYNFSIDAIPTALKNKNIGQGAHFKYGLVPLELVYSRDITELHYGATYVSLVTNFIPRSIYPEKPDSGGVIFTDAYARDKIAKTTNLATGLLPEAFINFSFIGGVLFSIVAFILMFIPLLKYYTCMIRNKSSGFYSSLRFPAYMLICNGVGAILVVEFTNLFLFLIIKVVFIVLLVCVIRSVIGSVSPCAKVRSV